MNNLFVRKDGGFIANYTGSQHYELTSGDQQRDVPSTSTQAVMRASRASSESITRSEIMLNKS